MRNLISGLLLLVTVIPAIGPDDVRPGPWFTPIDRAQQEADRQRDCAIYLARTGLVCDAHR